MPYRLYIYKDFLSVMLLGKQLLAYIFENLMKSIRERCKKKEEKN